MAFQIAVSPQPRVPGESVTVLHGNNFVLKVEGVTQQNTNKTSDESDLIQTSRAVFRKPKAVRLTVVSTPVPNPRAHAMMEHMKVSMAICHLLFSPNNKYKDKVD
jgi:hypothetical protein